MSDCAKQLTGVSGTARGNNPVKVLARAIRHLIAQGGQACAAGTCDAGTCTFGLTSLSDEVDVVELGGGDVQITVTGDGTCFCQQ